MGWIHHPRFVPVRDKVLDRLSARDVHFRRVRPVIFICGGHRSERRDRLAQYIRQHHGDYLAFYADDVWSLVARRPELNALDMEGQLADLSDLVIVVVESPGTFAELGAFSVPQKLREKLLPILDEAHRNRDSFISTGPVAWVNEQSRFRPAVWVDLETILEAADEIDIRLKRLPSKRTRERVADLAESPKHLVFFLADLAAMFGPCRLEDLGYYAETVLGTTPKVPLDVLVGWATALNVVRTVQEEGAERLFFRPLDDGNLRPFQATRYLNLPRLRAEILSAMQLIPAATAALDLVKS